MRLSRGWDVPPLPASIHRYPRRLSSRLATYMVRRARRTPGRRGGHFRSGLAHALRETAKMSEEEIERLRMRELNLWRRFCADTTSQARAEWRQARLEYMLYARRASGVKHIQQAQKADQVDQHPEG